MEFIRPLRWLFAYIARYRVEMILLLLGILFGVGIDTALRLSFKFLIDDVIAPQNHLLLVILLSAISVGVFIKSILAIIRDYLYAHLANKVLNDIRLQIFKHLQELSMNFYHQTQPAQLLARFSTDLAAIENVLIIALPNGVFAFLGLIISAVPFFWMEWHLAVLVIIGLPLCLLTPHLLQERAFAENYQTKNEHGHLMAVVEENINAQTIIKTFNLKRLTWQKFAQQNQTLFKIKTRACFVSYMLERAPQISLLLLELIFISLGAWWVFQGKLSIGMFVSLHALFIGLSQYATEFSTMFSPLIQAAAGVKRIEEILQEQPQIIDAPQAKAIGKLDEAICFQGVNFGYMLQQFHLKDLSFTIPKGWSVAFVGSSGSGKSTVLNLMIRLYDPVSGSIKIDNDDLREISRDSLREQCAFVLQENFLFNDSLRENIRLGRLEASDDEVEEAAKSAEIHDFIISLPQGYETLIGENGIRLSGGQKQRIAIARAILRNPPILLLDEATSSLDPSTEAAINQTLDRLCLTRTTVTVTHRLASAVNSDQIFVLDKGRLAEQGRHEELLAKNGIYWQLWQKQSGFALSADGKRAEINVERLRQVPILKDLSEDLLAEAAHLFVTENYLAGRAVVYQGDPGDRFYIIVRGTVDVLVKPPGDEEKRVAALQDGDYFGEIALLKKTPRAATIKTRTPCILLSLQHEHFSYLLRSAPHFQELLQKNLESYTLSSSSEP